MTIFDNLINEAVLFFGLHHSHSRFSQVIDNLRNFFSAIVALVIQEGVDSNQGTTPPNTSAAMNYDWARATEFIKSVIVNNLQKLSEGTCRLGHSIIRPSCLIKQVTKKELAPKLQDNWLVLPVDYQYGR